METDEKFEYPMPVLSADAEKINISASSACEGVFTIKNAGGGVLAGTVASGSAALEFSPKDFEGNLVKVRYVFTPGAYKPGDKISSAALIRSNGGEKVIPVTISLTPAALQTEDGAKLASLADFAAYARKRPAEAASLLRSAGFRRFLADAGYASAKAYGRIVEDADKERALENFLIISGLKDKSGLKVLQNSFDIRLKPGDGRPFSGSVPIGRVGWGYLDAPVRAGRNAPWLSFAKKVKASDFKNGDAFALPFAVDPKELKAAWDADALLIGDGEPLAVEIAVRRLPPVEASLPREFFGLDDEGFLRVVNNTGKDMLVEVASSESFVRFSGERYLIGEEADIPFQVRLSAFQTTQMVMRNQPYVEAEIDVRAGSGAGRFKKRLKIAAGEW